MGKNVPTNTNSTLAKLFSDNGFSGINFWTLVQFTSIVLVIWEASRYYKENEKNANPLTLGVFGIIILFLSLTAIPQFLQKLKENKILSGNTDTSPATIQPPNVGPAWLPTGFSYAIGSDGKYYAEVDQFWQQAIQDSATTGHLSGVNLVRVP